MKLYYAPNTCSLATEIVAAEAGIPLERDKVDLATHRTAAGLDYRTVSPLGYVPALRTDDDQVVTEGVAILQYLADLAPAANLAPRAGTFERVRLQEWLNLIATELHKSFSPWLFHPEVGAAAQSYAKTRIRDRLAYLDRRLATAPFLLGESFTIADAYAFTIVGWSKLVGIELEEYPALALYFAQIAKRPAVRAALRAHGMPGG
jgi:glutathione S-transferase